MRSAAVRVSLAAVLLSAAVARALLFGADLAAPADNTGTCSLMSASSCTFLSGAPGPGFYAPASGTVTAVRVRTGSFVQGPMQVVVMRSLFQNSGNPARPFFACCFVERYGPVFTPAPNAVTLVPASLPMVADPVPPPDDLVTTARGDFLALSVLAPDVPVPATFDGASVFSGFAPAPAPPSTPAPSPNPIFPVVNGYGYHMALNADLEPGRVGDAVPVTIATGGQLVGSTASIPVVCVLTSACHGVLRLTDVPAAALVAAARATGAGSARLFGKKRFSIGAGQTKTLRMRLNAAGRRKVRDVPSVLLVATARVAGQSVAAGVQLSR
jgi:hypothetical protein